MVRCDKISGKGSPEKRSAGGAILDCFSGSRLRLAEELAKDAKSGYRASGPRGLTAHDFRRRRLV